MQAFSLTMNTCICAIIGLLQVVYTLEPMLVEKAIQFPQGDEVSQVIEDFEELCQLPQCVGAVDGCLIPIKRPTGPWGFRYYCYKGFHALLLLAVVDARGYFTYIRSGYAGCVGDAAAWGGCALQSALQHDSFFPPECNRSFGNVVVAPFIVGDAAFPLAKHLMKCYNGNPREGTPNARFNYSLIRTRRVVENAFGRLKGRFRVLQSGRVNDVGFMPKLINFCCALHNMAQRHKDPFEESLFVSDFDPLGPPRPFRDDRAERRAATRAAGIIRDAIKDYLAT